MKRHFIAFLTTALLSTTALANDTDFYLVTCNGIPPGVYVIDSWAGTTVHIGTAIGFAENCESQGGTAYISFYPAREEDEFDF